PVAASGGAEGSPAGGRRFAAIHGRAATALSVFDSSGGRREVAGGYTEWTPTMAARGTSIAAVAASPERPYDVVRVDADTGAVTVLRAGSSTVDRAYLPEPVDRTFKGADGRDIHAHLYPPRNRDFTGPPT